jgi:hypothetical protein
MDSIQIAEIKNQIKALEATLPKQSRKEYKRDWARAKRLANGVEPRPVGFDNVAYMKKYMADKRAAMTPEEKEAASEHRNYNAETQRKYNASRAPKTQEEKDAYNQRKRELYHEKKALANVVI